MKKQLKQIAWLGFRCLPGWIKALIRQSYYAKVLKDFRKEQWPPSAGVQRLLTKGAKVVDVGANVGYVSRLFSEWVGPDGAVYSFEPVPDTFKVLASNIERLGLKNVHPVCAAASSMERDGFMEIPKYPEGRENYYESRVLSSDQAPQRAAAVKVRLGRLSTLLPGNAAPISLIKIDAEGHELDVVQGAIEVIRRDHPALLIEVEADPDQTDSPASRLFSLLETEGYKPCLLTGEVFQPRPSGARAIDYFFLPKRRFDQFFEGEKPARAE
jgi:FkbM family methyltransferase